MKQQMHAIIQFYYPDDMGLAIAELVKRSFKVEVLDWIDEDEGVVGSPTVWIKVCGACERADHNFFAEMRELTKPFGGDVCEAGALPPAA